jgi:hypothetical protein
MPSPSWVLANAVSGLQAIVAECELIYSANTVAPTAAAAFRLAVAVGPQVSAATPAPTATALGLYPAMVALYNALPMLVSPDLGVDPSVGPGVIALVEGLGSALDPAAAAAAFAFAADGWSDPPPAPASATANRAADSANAALLARFARMTFLAAYVEALVSMSFATRNDAITARADCVQRFERELMLCGLGTDIDVAAALTAMRDRAVAWLSQVEIDSKPVLTVTAAAELPAPFLAWRLWRDPSRAAELVSRNAAPVAEFMPLVFEALAA